MPSQYMCLLGLTSASSSQKGFELKSGWRDEEIAGAELAARHREGTDSFHLKKMMELAFTGALLLFAAAVATTQQQVSLPRPLSTWLLNFMNPNSNLSVTFFYCRNKMQSSEESIELWPFFRTGSCLLSSWVSLSREGSDSCHMEKNMWPVSVSAIEWGKSPFQCDMVCVW